MRQVKETGIPLVDINQLQPMPQGIVNLEYDGTSLDFALQMTKMYHNPALVQLRDGLCIVYDIEPCIRPYSPQPVKPDEPEIQDISHDTHYVDVLEVDEWDDFDEP